MKVTSILKFITPLALLTSPLHAYFNNQGQMNTDASGGCGCHSTAGYTLQDGDIVFKDSSGVVATKYEAGKNYIITVKLRPSLTFEATAGDATTASYRTAFRLSAIAGGTAIGTLANGSTVTGAQAQANAGTGSIAWRVQRLQSLGTADYQEVNINWTVPATASGDVLFSLGVGEGNNAGNADAGDSVSGVAFKTLAIAGPQAAAGSAAKKNSSTTGGSGDESSDDESGEFSGNFSGGCGAIQMHQTNNSIIIIAFGFILALGMCFGIRRKAQAVARANKKL